MTSLVCIKGTVTAIVVIFLVGTMADMHATVFPVSRLYDIVNEAVLAQESSGAIAAARGRVSSVDCWVISSACKVIVDVDTRRAWERSATEILAAAVPASRAAIDAHRAIMAAMPAPAQQQQQHVPMSIFRLFHEIDNCQDMWQVGPVASSILYRCLDILDAWAAAEGGVSAALVAPMSAALRSISAAPGKQPYPVWALYREAFDACYAAHPRVSTSMV